MIRAVLVGVLAMAVLVAFQTFGAAEDDDVSWFGFTDLTTKSKPGHDIALGGVVRNEGDTTITLRDLTLDDDVPTDQGLLREVLVLDTDADDADAVGAVWWPDAEFSRHTRPLAGHRVAPGDEVRFVIVIEVRGEGPMRWERGTLIYAEKGEEHSIAGTMGLTLCPTMQRCAGSAAA